MRMKKKKGKKKRKNDFSELRSEIVASSVFVLFIEFLRWEDGSVTARSSEGLFPKQPSDRQPTCLQ